MTKRRMSRRRLVQTGLYSLALGAMASLPLRRKSLSPDAHAAPALRPPGALAGDAFLSACIRCGLCVQACPYDTLQLAAPSASADAATPYFHARQIACEMCTDMPCVQACPSDALVLDDINNARIGVAVLSHPHFCNSYTGAAFCNSCYRACPLGDDAITMAVGKTPMRGMFTPTVDPEVCTGCGKCEQACIATPAAIRIQALNV